MTSAQLDIFDAMNQEERGDQWDRAVIRQAVFAHLEIHGQVSANTFRESLPEIVNRKLIGAVVRGMAMRRELAKVDDVTSTDGPTHGKPIGLYVAGPNAPHQSSRFGVPV